MAAELSGFRKTGVKVVLRADKLLGGWGVGHCEGLLGVHKAAGELDEDAA